MADLVRFAQTLTGSEPDIFEAVKRSNFETEDEYVDALTQEKLKRSAPDYAQTRRQIVAELSARDEEKQRKSQREEYSRIRSSVRLSADEEAAIDQQAATMAASDFAKGRLNGSLTEVQARYKKQLQQKQLDNKATAQMFNAMIRGRQ